MANVKSSESYVVLGVIVLISLSVTSLMLFVGFNVVISRMQEPGVIDRGLQYSVGFMFWVSGLILNSFVVPVWTKMLAKD